MTNAEKFEKVFGIDINRIFGWEPQKLDAWLDASADDGWIPCDERLPRITGDVLVTVHWNDFDHEVRIDNCDYEVPSVRYYDTVLKRSWGCGNEKVVAWMPLPEPFEDQKDG